MGLFSLEKIFGATIRESATDGSDFTNPDADYRRLFLGEDGLLHLKDSAGTVTDIGGGGIPATLLDAKGDLIAASAADTAARLAVGANDTVLMAASGEATGLKWGPTYSDWTPALTADTTNPTLGTGSAVSGRYAQVGKYVHAYGEISFGTSGVAAGSGAYEVQFPVAPRATLQRVLGHAILYDASAALFNFGIVYNLDTGEFRFAVSGSTNILVSNTAPWTWAASDIIGFNLTYEAA